MFKEILVAVDDSAQSTAALELAIALAKTIGASLTLVHAVDPGKIAAAAGDVGAATAIEVELEELQDAGRGLLDEAAARSRGAGLSVTPILRDGVPAATILDTAKRSNCDLIVLGTHGRSGVARLFLGSTAEAVLREAQIPVLIKRS